MKAFFQMNSLADYLVAAAIIGAGIVVVRIIKYVLSKRIGKISELHRNYFAKLVDFVYPIGYVVLVYLAIHTLDFPGKIEVFIKQVFTASLILLLVRLISAAAKAAFYTYLVRHDDSGDKIKQVKGIVLILNGVLWTMGLIFLFDNLGFNVTAVLTGLGVGGIAIALAAQTILGDIFNYFVIFFDQPFQLGDFIIVDDKMGTVEYIGIKTTRLKSLQGEQIIFANSNLTNSRIHNYKRMNERRILFKFGVVYETGSEKLSLIPAIVKRTISESANTRFDRAHFAAYGASSLDFEVVYYILSADYNSYMDTQQAINLSIYMEFENQNIQFAYPTMTVHAVYPKIKSAVMPEENHVQ
jgi:small-conductance mechanosensitive channel